MHVHDEVSYHGVTYLCGGAVSAAWWKGDHEGFPPAYVVVNFFDDGSFEKKLVPYA